MRIVTLTAGTGSFHCGSCMRDNALTVALRRAGHDAILAPLYLPMVLDEGSAAGDTPLFYGGVNVYLQQKSALFRRTPRWIDNLLDSPGLLRSAAKRAGMTRATELGELTLSSLMGENGRQAKELERLAEWLAKEGKPDIVVLSNALLLGIAPLVRERTGAAVVCTLQGEDSFLDGLPEPYRLEAWAKLGENGRAATDAFIAVSRYHGDLMTERATLPTDRVHVIHNGIMLDGYPTEPRQTMPDPPVLGYLARMTPLKGLETVVDAFIELKKRRTIPGLKLRVAGSQTDSDAAYVATTQKRLEQAGVADDAEFIPNVTREEKIQLLSGLSVLSVPALYGESFGLYLIEAMAAGTPVVQPRHAGFTEIVEETGGGILYDPDKEGAYIDTLESLLTDPERARELGERGRQSVHERFSVEVMAEAHVKVFEKALARRRDAVAV
jgi:glycosyltransferase involved in cell wall biosynthesis